MTGQPHEAPHLRLLRNHTETPYNFGGASNEADEV
jgi:hypothetical protein